MQPEEAFLLQVIHELPGPLGAQRATRELRRAGHELSESSVSRLLTRLDDAGLTQRIDRKGRVLTSAGEREVAARNGEQRLRASWEIASDVTSLGDLLDLLYVRRAIEREAARSAALRATAKDVERLREALEQHDERVRQKQPEREHALSFHRLVAEISGNRLLMVATELIFDPALDGTEAVLDVVVGSHGSASHSITEHAAVVEAIAAGDSDAAERAMVDHIDRLITETSEFAASSSGEEIVERLLQVMKFSPPHEPGVHR